MHSSLSVLREDGEAACDVDSNGMDHRWCHSANDGLFGTTYHDRAVRYRYWHRYRDIDGAHVSVRALRSRKAREVGQLRAVVRRCGYRDRRMLPFLAGFGFVTDFVVVLVRLRDELHFREHRVAPADCLPDNLRIGE